MALFRMMSNMAVVMHTPFEHLQPLLQRDNNLVCMHFGEKREREMGGVGVRGSFRSRAALLVKDAPFSGSNSYS